MKNGEKKILSEKVADMLRTKIINGELQADSRIIESDVAKCMEVSRGPVREALKILEFEGLVTYESNKGCRVTNLSMEDAYEIFFLRGNLEIMALRQAGGRLPDTSLLTMRSYLEGMERAQKDKNLLYMVQMDELFHREIVSEGNMKRLVRMWESLSPLNGAMFLKVNDTFELREGETAEEIFGNYRRRDNYESHKLLLEKLCGIDLEGAVLCLRNHYVQTGERIYKIESRRRLLKETL